MPATAGTSQQAALTHGPSTHLAGPCQELLSRSSWSLAVDALQHDDELYEVETGRSSKSLPPYSSLPPTTSFLGEPGSAINALMDLKIRCRPAVAQVGFAAPFLGDFRPAMEALQRGTGGRALDRHVELLRCQLGGGGRAVEAALLARGYTTSVVSFAGVIELRESYRARLLRHPSECEEALLEALSQGCQYALFGDETSLERCLWHKLCLALLFDTVRGTGMCLCITAYHFEPETPTLRVLIFDAKFLQFHREVVRGQAHLESTWRYTPRPATFVSDRRFAELYNGEGAPEFKAALMRLHRMHHEGVPRWGSGIPNEVAGVVGCGVTGAETYRRVNVADASHGNPSRWIIALEHDDVERGPLGGRALLQHGRQAFAEMLQSEEGVGIAFRRAFQGKIVTCVSRFVPIRSESGVKRLKEHWAIPGGAQELQHPPPSTTWARGSYTCVTGPLKGLIPKDWGTNAEYLCRVMGWKGLAFAVSSGDGKSEVLHDLAYIVPQPRPTAPLLCGLMRVFSPGLSIRFGISVARKVMDQTATYLDQPSSWISIREFQRRYADGRIKTSWTPLSSSELLEVYSPFVSVFRQHPSLYASPKTFSDTARDINRLASQEKYEMPIPPDHLRRLLSALHDQYQDDVKQAQADKEAAAKRMRMDVKAQSLSMMQAGRARELSPAQFGLAMAKKRSRSYQT